MFKLQFLRVSLVTPVFLISSAFASEKLIFAIDIIRHGDRTPLIDIPTAPSH